MYEIGSGGRSGGPKEGTVRIAMWSGPRNISTAMMRAFEKRADTAVIDEPFYAAFLAITGADHPMREAILEAGETDWRKVAATVSGPAPGGKAVFFQKHMTHHMVPAIGRDWMGACRHAFLIRDPDRVLASYQRKRTVVRLTDLGFAEQVELYELAQSLAGEPPPVVDADRLLEDPEGMLRALCSFLGIPFDAAMLAWPPGPRSSDGIWATHWYDAVRKSVGFEPPRPTVPVLGDARLREISRQARPLYDRLAEHALVQLQPPRPGD